MTAQTEEDWEDLPLFAPEGTTIPQKTDDSDTSAVGALSHLIYDEDTPEEASELLRELGNRSFKLGKSGYKRAIEEYTKAITAAGGGPVALHAYLNRANAHYRLGNYGYALTDARHALKIDSGHIKAHYRAVLSARALRRYEDCLTHCAAGLSLSGGDIFAQIREEVSQKLSEERERVLRRSGAEERIRLMLQERGITIGTPLFEAQTRYSSTIPKWAGSWVWPVLIVYMGEIERSDYLEEVDEQATIGDILETVLAEPPDWDTIGLYADKEMVELRFRRLWTVLREEVVEGEEGVVGSDVCEPGEWVSLVKEESLVEVLTKDGYVVPLFPVFYAVPKGWRG